MSVEPFVLKFRASLAAVRNRYPGALTARLAPATPEESAAKVKGQSNVPLLEKKPHCAGV